MTDYRVEKYTYGREQQWDEFVKNAKNGSFLFQRAFMEYHDDRFEDHSLLVFRKNKLVALLPANIDNNKVYSHQGLTYGGFLLSATTKFKKILEAFRATLKYLADKKTDALIIKPLPYIYQSYPAAEMEYLRFILKARLTERQLSAGIYIPNRLKIAYNRRRGAQTASKKGLVVRKNTDFESFWTKILIPNLEKQYQVRPVHSVSEIQHLAEKFPENIHQYNVYRAGEIVGGTTVFETKTTAHTQYISAGEGRQAYRTNDFLMQKLITEEFAHKTYFDFGTSNESAGAHLNGGLHYWKETFGARGVAYDRFEINPNNFNLLDRVLI